MSLCALAPGAETDVRLDPTVAAVQQVLPSVVNIATKNVVPVRDPMEELFREFWDPYYRRQPPDAEYSLGSGVIIDEAGYVLTNDHVVRRADQIAVKLAAGTNIYQATIVAADPKTDVALLKLKARPGERFHAIKFARQDDLLLGETVLALGNPFGLGGTVTRGILSSKSRSVPKEGQPLDEQDWLQTDAPINPGNSGGPLVDLRGELIGINVAMLSQAQGIGFAIPIRLVEQSLSQIFPTEFVKGWWFGARIKVGTSPLVVTTVQPESPAGRGGVRPGDQILQVNGQAPKSFIDFADLVAASPRVSLTVRRGTRELNLPVTLVPETTIFNAQLIRQKLGLDLETLTPELAQRYDVSPSEGFAITGVQRGGPAEAAGLQTGMLITAVDGQMPADLTTLAKMIYEKSKGETIRLDVDVLERVGNFNVLRQVPVELVPR